MTQPEPLREETPTPQPQARLFEIQRMSTEDGPGIRTTVFFKGCGLSCRWCHNPESISVRPQIVWHEPKCIGCRSCVEACPHQARLLDEQGVHVDQQRCQSCGSCVEACPTTALEQLGSTWQLEPLLVEVAKDRAYYETSAGGVTLSGGEPVLQASFARRFAERCRAEGIHTALDTAGRCHRAALLELVGHCDLILFDIKEIDEARHRAFTGHSNAQILGNALAVAECIRNGGCDAELWIRTPLVPTATATHDNIQGIGAYIAEHLADVVQRWELCAFNHLCRDKYRRLGLEWAFADVSPLSAAELAEFAAVAKATGVNRAIVHADGPTRGEP